MSYLRIQKDGLFEYEWDGESQSYTSELISPERVISRLRMSCRIDEGVTLGDIFRIVASYPAMVQFLGEYSWCWKIQAFHNQALLPPSSRKDEEALEYLEISRYVEIDDDDFGDNLNFSGIGPHKEHGLNTHWSVSYSPMNEIAHLPVRLKGVADIRKAHEKIAESKCVFALLDILDAIYDDISFHGGPEENAEFLGELKGMVADIEAGTAKLVPMEEVFGKDTVN